MVVWARKWIPNGMEINRIRWYEKIRGSTKIEFIWAKLPMQLL